MIADISELPSEFPNVNQNEDNAPPAAQNLPEPQAGPSGQCHSPSTELLASSNQETSVKQVVEDNPVNDSNSVDFGSQNTNANCNRDFTDVESRQSTTCNKTLANYSRFQFPIVLNSNVRSLLNKLDDLYCVLSTNNVDVAVLTETWCHSDNPELSTNIPGYYVFRNDRDDGRAGGGVIIAVRNTIPCKMWQELSDDGIESIWVTLRPNLMPHDVSHICVCAIYHPPRANDQSLTLHISHGH